MVRSRSFFALCPIYGWQVTTLWVNCPLQINQPCQLSLPSLRSQHGHNFITIIVVPLTLLSALTSFHLCSLQLHSSASRSNIFVANNAWLPTRTRMTQIQLWSVVFQALPFHYSSKYKVSLHFLTQWWHSKHLLILGPKCLMHFSAKLSETLWGNSADKLCYDNHT